MGQPIYDVVVIGAGPGGASAAIYTSRADLRTLVLDKPGRTGSLAYAEVVANYPGVAGPLSGTELVTRIRAQAESFGAIFGHDVVLGVQFDAEPKLVFGEKATYETRAVIIATGAHERNNLLPGEQEYLGMGVSTCATCDAAFYRGKHVTVTGNDDHAAEEALAIAHFARTLVLAVPPGRSLLSPEALASLAGAGKVIVRQGTRIRAIAGDGTRVTGATLLTPEGETTIETDGVFLFVGGAKPSVGFLQGALPLDETGAIIVNEDRSAAVPRVYAVGDVAARHVRQAVIAAAEGCIAALAAERDLRGKKQLGRDYH
jgi:thioredoxin reductase (NADPH)